MKTFKSSTLYFLFIFAITLLVSTVSCSKREFSESGLNATDFGDNPSLDDDDDHGGGGDDDDSDDDDDDDVDNPDSGTGTQFELLNLDPLSTDVGATVAVKIEGTGFGNDPNRIKVYFGDPAEKGSLAKITSVIDTLIECESPFKIFPGAYVVSVAIDGTLASVETPFSYTIPKFIKVDKKGISPNVGLVDGGTEVTITGSNFPITAQVDFGTQTATCTVSSTTEIKCTTPSNSKGTVDVKVYDTASTQSYTVESGFTYYEELSITSVSNKMTNSKKNLYTVKILGSNFQIKGFQTQVRIDKASPKNCTVKESKIVCKRVSGNPGESFSVSVKIDGIGRVKESSTWESAPDDSSGDDPSDDQNGDQDEL